MGYIDVYPSESARLKGIVVVRVTENGVLVARPQILRNLILNQGLNIWPRILNGEVVPTNLTMKIGTDATAPSPDQTGIIAEFQSVVAMVDFPVGAPYATFFATFPGTGVSADIAEAALYIGGVGVARVLISETKGANRVMSIEWTFNFGRS